MYKSLLLILALVSIISCSENNTQSTDLAQQSSIGSTTDNETTQTVKYVEGVDYRIVENISLDASVSEPNVVEYFWLGCGHCQELEPHINSFSIENKVTLVKKPAPIQKRWVLDAKTYYALSEMGKSYLFDDLFKMYRQMNSQGKLPDKSDIGDFLKRNNVDIAAFNRAMSSENVTAKLQQNLREMASNKVTGVPALVVNGKYLIIPTEKIQNYQDYFDLIKFLLTKK